MLAATTLEVRTAKKLVGEADPDWDDMSAYVVHCTKPSLGRTAYQSFISILAKRTLKARSRFGSGKNDKASLKRVRFSEVPLHNVSRIVKNVGTSGLRGPTSNKTAHLVGNARYRKVSGVPLS